MRIKQLNEIGRLSASAARVRKFISVDVHSLLRRCGGMLIRTKSAVLLLQQHSAFSSIQLEAIADELRCRLTARDQ